jgi:hypothetical protein
MSTSDHNEIVMAYRITFALPRATRIKIPYRLLLFAQHFIAINVISLAGVANQCQAAQRHDEGDQIDIRQALA